MTAAKPPLHRNNIVATFLTILLITFTDGSTYELPFKSGQECGEAIARVETISSDNGFPVEMVQCVPTVVVTKSPVPKRRPEEAL